VLHYNIGEAAEILSAYDWREQLIADGRLDRSGVAKAPAPPARRDASGYLPDPSIQTLRNALEGPATASPTSSDWFRRGMAETGSSPEGAADLRVRFEGLPRGSKVDSSLTGMFREISIDRGRSMQVPHDI
jgi:hypothetical protein